MVKAVGAWPRPWGRDQGVRANPNPNPKAVGRSQSRGALPRPSRRAQGRGRVAKAVGA